MAIRKTTRTPNAYRRTISAGTSITQNAQPRQARQTRNVMANTDAFAKLSPEQQRFARQLQNTCRRQSAIMGATNTANIMARPDFLELLPMFVQKLLILDVFGSVAMKSRQQLIPYFKFIAENTKGETRRGTILNSPFVNRQGMDPNFTGRVVKKEAVEGMTLAYTPVLPGSVTLEVADAEGTVTRYIDNGAGGFVDNNGAVVEGAEVEYASGAIFGVDGQVSATYQYDNETVGPDADGDYGAKMAKGYLQLDEINLVAEAHELACYWSIYSAFAAQTEYGANIGDMAKDAAFAELTAEINTKGFHELEKAAAYKPQFNWDASPVLSGSVVPSDYLNMFKLKLGQAAASIYQATRLTRPNRLIVGSTAAEYIAMINGFKAENIEDTVGPYKFGKLDQFDIYVDPNYDPNKWVMACKSNDIRRNSALFGEYMPLTNTDAIGLANASVQQGYATMYAMKVVNPDTVVSGKILGTF
ncbi:MAG: hypothetical protein J6I97_08345 [Agathobacter sp.]|nr:hypothetical protein [Agathobacter sp.]